MYCREPDVNQFNLDEDGDSDDTDYSECVNTCGLQEEDEDEGIAD